MAINTTNLETVLNTKIAAATSSTPDKDLLIISKSVEALDNSIALKLEDIGVTVQAYDATNLVDADIGVTVQAYDANAATTSDITTAISALVDSAPGTLDTLNELAAALGDDPNHVTTMTTLIGTKETADADISKTDVAETRTANIDLLTYTETTISTSGTIDLSLGTVFTHTHTGGMSSFTLSNVPTTGTSGFILILENGGAYPLTWWTGLVWPAATPPTLTAAGTDIFTFTTPDSGVTWYGIPSGIGMA
jgi:hypothetical protein